MENTEQPVIIAHRGASIDGYENSFEAFKLGVKQKADMIELDTHITSDGYFIVHHDDKISFENQEYIIAETPLDTILNIRLPNDEPVPLLKAVLTQFLSKIQFNVEIKCYLQREDFDKFLEEVGGDNSRIIVSSFLKDVLYELNSSKLGYELAYLYILPGLKYRKIANENFISAMHPFYKLLTSKQIEYCHKRKKKINTWTVNSEKDIMKLVTKGVDGIITDQPLKTREIIEKYLK